MTTGSYSIGNPFGAAYFYKGWNGADGRTTENNYVADFITRKRGRSGLRWNPTIGLFFANSAQLPLVWGANDTIKLHSKFGDVYKGHEFNMGVAIGEGRETSRMVKNAASGIFNSVRSLKKGRVDDAVRHLTRAAAGNSTSSTGRPGKLDTKDISSQWLAIQYGWKPLLNDVYNSAKAFEHLSAPPRTRKVRASYSISGRGNASTSPSNWSANSRRRITYRLELTISENLASAPRSLGLLNPLQVAWELVPFSFVADWFIPVGDYLNAVTATPPHVDTVALLGIKDEAVTEVSGSNIINTSTYLPNGFYFHEKKVHIERVPGYVISTPPPKFADLKDVYNFDRAKNAVALLHQLFT